MKTWFNFVFFLFFLLSGWLYSNVWPLSLALLLPYYFAWKDKAGTAFGLAFTAGLVFDLINLLPLGLSSAVFLVLTWLFWLITARAEKDNLVLLTAFVFGGDLLWQKIAVNNVSIFSGAVFSFCFWLFFYVVKNRLSAGDGEEIFLR